MILNGLAAVLPLGAVSHSSVASKFAFLFGCASRCIIRQAMPDGSTREKALCGRPAMKAIMDAAEQDKSVDRQGCRNFSVERRSALSCKFHFK